MRYWHDCREGAVGWKKPFFRRDEAGQGRNLMRTIKLDLKGEGATTIVRIRFCKIMPKVRHDTGASDTN